MSFYKEECFTARKRLKTCWSQPPCPFLVKHRLLDMWSEPQKLGKAGWRGAGGREREGEREGEGRETEETESLRALRHATVFNVSQEIQPQGFSLLSFFGDFQNGCFRFGFLLHQPSKWVPLKK